MYIIIIRTKKLRGKNNINLSIICIAPRNGINLNFKSWPTITIELFELAWYNVINYNIKKQERSTLRTMENSFELCLSARQMHQI